MTEYQKMLAGEPYLAADKELAGMRTRCRQMTRAYNSTREDERDVRRALLNRLLGKMPPKIEIEPPFRCDYGFNILLGQNFYANFGVVMLDCAPITIGDDALIGPNVQFYAATHSTDPAERLGGLERARSITVGNNVWIGGGAIICPGVTIGDDVTIGAGSVVTRDIPSNCVAAGNPCRVIRGGPEQ